MSVKYCCDACGRECESDDMRGLYLQVTTPSCFYGVRAESRSLHIGDVCGACQTNAIPTMKSALSTVAAQGATAPLAPSIGRPDASGNFSAT